jgi:hypothetical protein
MRYWQTFLVVAALATAAAIAFAHKVLPHGVGAFGITTISIQALAEELFRLTSLRLTR